LKTEWLEGIERGDVAQLGRLLNSGADVNARDRYGQTGLMIAAGRGKADVLRLLIDRGAALDQTAKFGLSAVMLAVINGHVEIVRPARDWTFVVPVRQVFPERAPQTSRQSAASLQWRRLFAARRPRNHRTTWHWSAGQDAIRGGSVRRVPEVPEDRRGLPRGQPRCVEGGGRAEKAGLREIARVLASHEARR